MPEPNWAAYQTAVLEFFPPGLPRVEVDLTAPVGSGVVRALTEACPGPTFAVITACNPRGAQYTDEENEERCLDLEARLDAEGLAFIRADGCSSDREHRERGVAVRLDRAPARELAQALDQYAIYWWDGRRFWLVPVRDAEREPEALPQGYHDETTLPREETLRLTDFLRDSDFSA